MSLGTPTVPTVLNTSNCFIYGNTASGNALTVQQLGAGNVVAFSNASGSVGLFVSATSNVGINQTTPLTPLQITATASNSAVFIDNSITGGVAPYNTVRPSSSGAGAANCHIWSDGNAVGTSDAGFLRIAAGGGSAGTTKSYIDLSGYSTVTDMNQNIVLGTQGAERMRITSAGNVGIGVTNPAQTLTVGTGGTVNFSNALYTQFNTITSQYYTLSTLQGGYNTTSSSYSGGVYTWTAAGAGGQFAGAGATLVEGGTYQFSITIKTTTSGSAATFQLESPSFNVLYTSPAVLTTSYVNYTFIVTAPAGASGMIFRYSAGVNGSVININAFSVSRLDTIGTGNVGIGTTSPTAVLNVRGDVKTSGYGVNMYYYNTGSVSSQTTFTVGIASILNSNGERLTDGIYAITIVRGDSNSGFAGLTGFITCYGSGTSNGIASNGAISTNFGNFTNIFYTGSSMFTASISGGNSIQWTFAPAGYPDYNQVRMSRLCSLWTN
jgi:hypothetical protein